MRNRKIDKEKLHRILFFFVLLSLICSIIYVIVCLIIAPSSPEEAADGQRLKSDYILMLLQCSLGVIAIFLPSFISRTFKLKIPSLMLVFYIVFLYGAIYLGEVRSFYYHVPHWDTVLHTFSGAMLGALGFSIVNILNRHEKVPVKLSPMFVCMFAFCFAVTMGVFWEIYEFTGDGVLGLNMQKFMLENGDQLVGRAALIDTMKDLIVDGLGAFIMCVIGYISIVGRKGWIEDLMLKKADEADHPAAVK